MCSSILIRFFCLCRRPQVSCWYATFTSGVPLSLQYLPMHCFLYSLFAGVNKCCIRTHTCGELRGSDVGKHVRLCGWLQFQRMNKFATIRDSYGTTQLIIPDHVRKNYLVLFCHSSVILN